jgi:TonB-linked SusC/RagA family outer membrane protein
MNRNIIAKILGVALLAICSQHLMAQRAGEIIKGNVYDAEGPIMMANVLEVDAANRTVAHGVTDVNGNFSFRIVNPKDRLSISYVGYAKRVIPISGTVYKIRMQDVTQIRNVDIVGKHRRSESMALNVPERELSIATQKIDAKEFEGLGVTTVDEALQGRIAGLDIVANSGNLGSGTSMRLRGVSSINGNSEPLIVVDGNVWETDKNNNFDYNNANEERFAELLNVNPNDIASISVKKDAAATAIWGSQGANGVIEITTKRGARGKTQVSYSYRFTGMVQPKGLKMLNGDEYTMLLKEEYFNPKLSDNSSDIREINYDPSYSEYEMYNDNTDWRKAVRQFGQKHSHYLALSGGGEKANFRIAGGYDKEKGSVIGQNLDRFSTRVALDYFVSDRIKIVTNFALTYTNNKRNYYTDVDGAKSLLQLAYEKMPNLAIYEQDENGNSTGRYYNMLATANSKLNDQKGYENPVELAYKAKNNLKSYNIVPEFQLVYNLLGLQDDQTQLKYEGKIVFDVTNEYNDRFYPTELQTGGWGSTDANRAYNNSYKSLGITTTHTLTFIPHFKNEDHSFMALLRGQMTTGNSNTQTTEKYGLPTSNIQVPSADGMVYSFGTGAGQWRSVYFTFSAHYAYKGRYMVDFSVRRDGSTKFGPDQRWGNFPAVSLRWNVTDEPWMKGTSKWLSMLSIRPGWGRVGNQPGSEGLFYSKYVNGESYAGYTTIYPNNIRLSNLKWESKETYNIGFDYGFFHDMLSGDVNLYRQKTTDLLMYGRKIPSSSGFSSLSVQNNGTMMNTGWEFNINGNRLFHVGKFSVDLNASFANNKNELTKMNATLLSSLNSEFDRSNGSYLSRVQLNNAFGSIYGFRYKGVYQYSEYSATEVKGVSGPNAPVVRGSDGTVILDEKGKTKPMYFAYGTTAAYEFKGGDAMYEDINHDGNINELDIVYLGSSLPKITGGFGFKINYGNFQLNTQFNFRAGNKIINASRMYAENMYGNNNQSKAVNWRWRVEGDETSIPRALYQSGYNWLGSDRFVEDGSFLRLNYTQLSYRFDRQSLQKLNLGITSIRLFLTVNDLFCLTKYSGADPEVGYGSYGVTSDNGNTPRSKSFTAGVTVDF